jgi:hypothetical protein
MKRRLLNLLTALSLLLCVAVVGMWVIGIEQSYVIRDGGGGFAGGSDRATYVLVVGERGIGIGWTHSDVWFEGEVAPPLWLAALVFAALPCWWAASFISHRRINTVNICPRCCYDIRATPGRCPECGWTQPDVRSAT